MNTAAIYNDILPVQREREKREWLGEPEGEGEGYLGERSTRRAYTSAPAQGKL